MPSWFRKTGDLEETVVASWVLPGIPPTEIVLFAGDIAEAPADAIATSTNPYLSLGGGTGRSVVAAGGWEVKREAESILEARAARGVPKALPAGSVVATGPGRLPYRLVLHAVAADAKHTSSAQTVRACAGGVVAGAEGAGCRSVAVPVFGAGHAELPFETALTALVQGLESAPVRLPRVVVVARPDRRQAAEAVLDRLLDRFSR